LAPFVSVIVPNYNHAAYLKRRIDSILDQTYQNFELILLDDNSSDDSVNVLKEYISHPKVTHYCFNEINSGSPFLQWKRGIDIAKGHFIWIAESDDYASPRFLEVLIERISINKEVTLAYCGSNLIDKYDSILGNTYFYTTTLDEKRWLNDFENTGIAECLKYLLYQNTIPNASAVLFSREKYLKTSGGDQNYRLCGDWKLWFEMLMLEGNIQYIAETLNNFRQLDSAKKKYNTIFKSEALKVMLFVYSYSQIRSNKLVRLAVFKRMYGWCFLKGGGVLKIDSKFEVTISNLRLFFSLPINVQSYFPVHLFSVIVFRAKYYLKMFLNRTF